MRLPNIKLTIYCFVSFFLYSQCGLACRGEQIGEEPLDKAQLVKLIKEGEGDAHIARLIERQGLSFNVTGTIVSECYEKKGWQQQQ